MHFSIPDTVELAEQKQGAPKYTAYVVHIDGVRHCLVRYRQLHTLQEHLRKEFPSMVALPVQFPSKKLLPLSASQIEERRQGLERYLQLVSQDPRVSYSVAFNGFLLAAQLETRLADLQDDTSPAAVAEKTSLVDIDVFLTNGQKVSLRAKNILQTEEVIEQVCGQLGVPAHHVHHFGLFLVQRKEHSGEIVIWRRLQDFEAAYISHRAALARNSAGSGSLRLVLRKTCWDPDIDRSLFAEKATLNLLYIQTISEVERGWVQTEPATQRRLAELQAMGDKNKYMEVASALPHYGCIHFQPAICDYPSSNTPAKIMIGNRELVMTIRTSSGEIKEGVFKVTKMRCWRIMTLAQPNDLQVGETPPSGLKLELSFEYLMANQELQWITIVSSQAILMSMCLQSMVEELLRIRNDAPIKVAREEPNKSEYKFQRRDGSAQKITIRVPEIPKCEGCPQVPKIDAKTLAAMTSRMYSVKKLSERFDKLNFRDAARAAEDVLIENEAFVDIRETTDDDKSL